MPKDIFSAVLMQYPYIPPVVQSHFVNDPGYLDYLLSNPHLDDGLVTRQLGKKLSAVEMEQWVNRQLTQSQRHQVLSKETRRGVLLNLVRNTDSTDSDEVLYTLEHLKAPGLIVDLYYHVRHNPAVSDKVGARLVGQERLRWFTDMLDPDPVVVLETLETLGGTSPQRRVNVADVVRLFDVHPSVLSKVLELSTTPWILAAAANSVSLTEKDQARLLGLKLDDLDQNPSLGTLLVKPPLYVAGNLVRNVVTTKRILDFIGRISKDSVNTQRALLSRAHLNLPDYAPSLRGVTAPEFNKLLLQACAYRMFEARYSGVVSSRRHWLYMVLSSGDSEVIKSVSELLSDTALLHSVGPYHAASAKKLLAENGVDRSKGSSPGPASVGLSPIYDDGILDIYVHHYPFDDASHIGRAVGEVLLERFGENLSKWQLFADMAANTLTSPAVKTVGEITTLVNRVVH